MRFTSIAACASPKNTRSALVLLIFVSCALKSTALSFVNSRATIVPPFAFTDFSNSSASPWPNAVRSSMIAMRFALVTLAAYAPALPAFCVSVAITRYTVPARRA